MDALDGVNPESVYAEGYKEGYEAFRRKIMDQLTQMDVRVTLGIVRERMTVEEVKEMLRNAE